MTGVYLEVATRKVFAGALDWPGWCRAGKSEDEALGALLEYRPRYSPVAELAGFEVPGDAFEVLERVAGSATTDFGAPGAAPTLDYAPYDADEAQRLAALVAAAWKVLDGIVSRAPAELRKGPRGGGRDRDKMVDHVLGAEQAYAGKLGIRPRDLPPDDAGPGSSLRRAMLEVIGAAWDGAPLKEPSKGPSQAKGWPPRYGARRIAWHALDHAWEIEDRTEA